MDGLSFVTAPPPVESDPARADIACFVGFVARRGGDLPAQRGTLKTALEKLDWTGPDLPPSARLIPDDLAPGGDSIRSFTSWLKRAGWTQAVPSKQKPTPRPVPEAQLFLELLRLWHPPAIVEWWKAAAYLQPFGPLSAVDILELREVPVPVERWDIFDEIFAWDARPISAVAGHCDTALGAAVRSFFAQGGRKCYVVRLGDPWPVLAAAGQRGISLSEFLPELPPPSAVDRRSWRGLGQLFGLPDVSFLCLPDLPDFFSVASLGQEKIAPPATPEVFVECATRVDAPAERTLRGIPAPTCDRAGFEGWARFVKRVGAFLSGSVREVQFIAAIPLPVGGPAGGASPLAAQWKSVATIDTAFVQLVYPWLRTRTSALLPGGVEAPDGVLAGVLANSALTRGSWRSAIRQPVSGIAVVEPVLNRAMLACDLTPPKSRRLPLTLRERVTVIAPAPGGFRLLSDVTTDEDEAYRPANINRLINAIIRAARVTGEPTVFQNNGPALWARLRENLTGLLGGLWADGALDGASAEEAYDVRCDRSTMTQADLDAGRLICRVSFTAASPIVHLTVVFAMDEGGQVSLASREALAAPRAQAA